MARHSSQEGAGEILFRKPTTDVKDIQDVLKSVMSKSSGFVSRHASINENDMAQPRPILTRTPSPKPILRTPSPKQGDEVPDGLPRRHRPTYGELIVLGTNGSLPCPTLSAKMSHKYVLKKQPRATGVSLIMRDPANADSLARKSTHTVLMAPAKESGKQCVMEFGPDLSMDMFQIGRSADSAIDMVVVDTVESEEGKKVFNNSSTVSRYACRILCEREPPYTARIYAAAFDTHSKIKLSPLAPTWVDSVTGDTDGLTTNGIALLRPVGVFESGVEPDTWKEVTVMGNIRETRVQRSSRQPNTALPGETNMLTDGCLIDLCGVTLMWRTAMGLDHGPSNTLLREKRQELNDMTPHCPVNFTTLVFKAGKLVSGPVDNGEEEGSREPWMYLACGHVFGRHEWKETPDETRHTRTCPMCRRIGPYVKLELGQERAYFVDEGPLSHSFVPCGHVTTEQTVKYWSKVKIPHHSSTWIAKCPFCCVPLDDDMPYVKLLFN